MDKVCSLFSPDFGSSAVGMNRAVLIFWELDSFVLWQLSGMALHTKMKMYKQTDIQGKALNLYWGFVQSDGCGHGIQSIHVLERLGWKEGIAWRPDSLVSQVSGLCEYGHGVNNFNQILAAQLWA